MTPIPGLDLRGRPLPWCPCCSSSPFAVGEGLYALLGYKPENADAPVWVNLVALTPVIVVALIPSAAEVFFGRRASESGDHRVRPPPL